MTIEYRWNLSNFYRINNNDWVEMPKVLFFFWWKYRIYFPSKSVVALVRFHRVSSYRSFPRISFVSNLRIFTRHRDPLFRSKILSSYLFTLAVAGWISSTILHDIVVLLALLFCAFASILIKHPR